MKEKREIEIIEHSVMSNLHVFLVEMINRTPHGHSDFEMGIVLEGDIDLFADSNYFSLKQGNIYILNRYNYHSFNCPHGNALLLSFQIQDTFYKQINPQLSYLRINKTVITSDDVVYQTIKNELFKCAKWYFGKAEFHDLKSMAAILEVFYSLLSSRCASIGSQKENDKAKQNSARMDRYLECISSRYTEQISLKTLADIDNLSTYYVSHFFKETLGMSFQEYLNNYRFQKALYLANHTNLKIIDICLETGFSSSKYLNHMFIKNFGMTAKQYINSEKKPRQLPERISSVNRQNIFSFEQSAVMFQKNYEKYYK